MGSGGMLPQENVSNRYSQIAPEDMFGPNVTRVLTPVLPVVTTAS